VTDEEHVWAKETLLAKARLYAQRAAAEETGTSLEALWSLLGFEFLARAALAQEHPALLADPKEGANLLYGFGFGNPQAPKSVNTATVLRRCRVVVPGFTEDDVKEASALVNLRNAELHSGSSVLEELPTSGWMPQFYRLTQVLLDHLKLGLADFLSEEQAKSATEVIKGLTDAAKGEVKQRIADQRTAFENLDVEVQESLQESGPPEEVTELNWMRVIACPACRTRNAIKGEISDFSQPRVGEDQIELSADVLPTGYSCRACRLELRNHGEMLHAGLGDQYSITQTEDPIDFYGIDPRDLVDPADFYEPDYGND
jgi:hypothetical protein